MKRHGKREIGDHHKRRLISQELIRIRDRESAAGVDTESEDEIPSIPEFPPALKEDGDSRDCWCPDLMKRTSARKSTTYHNLTRHLNRMVHHNNVSWTLKVFYRETKKSSERVFSEVVFSA
jgi:hypothetical protein